MTPDSHIMQEFLLALFGNQLNGTVELAWTDQIDKKLRRAELFHLDNLDNLIAKAVEVNTVEGQNAYIGAALRIAPPSKPVTLAPAMERCQIRSELIQLKSVVSRRPKLHPFQRRSILQPKRKLDRIGRTVDVTHQRQHLFLPTLPDVKMPKVRFRRYSNCTKLVIAYGSWP